MSNEIDFGAEMQELANVIAQYAPDGWEKMYTAFEEYEPGNYGIDSWAIIGNENSPVDFDEKDTDALVEIFKTIKEKSIESWKTAQFSFTNEGDCEINFEY